MCHQGISRELFEEEQPLGLGSSEWTAAVDESHEG